MLKWAMKMVVEDPWGTGNSLGELVPDKVLDFFIYSD